MVTVSVDEIRRDLPGYLRRVEAGESLLIVQGDRLLAEIKPVEGSIGKNRPRPVGLGAGDFTVPADFDAPLPEEVLRGYEGH